MHKTIWPQGNISGAEDDIQNKDCTLYFIHKARKATMTMGQSVNKEKLLEIKTVIVKIKI